MAVATTNAFSGPFTANGVTTTFPFTFTVLSGADVAVALRDADGVETAVTSGFTVTLAGDAPASGSVVFDTAPASGNEVWLYLDPAFTQETEFADGHPFLAGAVNNVNDLAALRDQVLRRDVDRSPMVPIGEMAPEMASLTGQDGKVLGVVGGKIIPVENDVVAAADYAAASAASAVESSEHADASEAARLFAEAAQAAAEQAETGAVGAALTATGYYPGARSHVPRGMTSVTITAAGSGGTNGTYTCPLTGDNLTVDAYATVTVSGGAVTAVTVAAPGLYIGASPTAGTVDTTAITGLTGATLTPTIGYLKTSGQYYLTDHASSAGQVSLFQNQANAAVEVDASVDWLNIALSQSWAEGTLPGGAGTKSAKEWAEDAAADVLPSRAGINNYRTTAGFWLAGDVVVDFAEKTFTAGYWLNNVYYSGGTTYKGSSDYLPIVGGKAYTYSSAINGNASIQFYDAALTYVGGVKGSDLAAASYVFTPPSTAAFIRVTALATDVAANNVKITANAAYLRTTGLATSAEVTTATRIFSHQKKIMAVVNNETTTLVTFDQPTKTIVFPAGVQLVDKAVGRYFTLASTQTIALGAFNIGILYYDALDSTIKFRNVATVDETTTVYDTFHKVDTNYIIGVVNSAATSKSLSIDATYYSIDGVIYGRGDKYFNDQITAINGKFGSDPLLSQWFIGTPETLTTAGSRSVITAIKDIWFDFHEGKPSWWDDCRLRLTCVFRPDYTGSPTANDTLFQFRVVSADGTTVNVINNFFRFEIEAVGTSGLNLYTKTITVNGESVRINIYADLSKYSNTIPVPRDDTTFMVWARLKTTSIFKDALEKSLLRSKLWYGGSKLYVFDQWPTQIFKRGLTTDSAVGSIGLVTKSLPLPADYVTTPYDPSALTILRDTIRDTNVPAYKYGEDMVALTYDEAGDKAWIVSDFAKFTNKKVGVELDVVKRSRADISATSFNVLCFGASSTDSGLASYTKLLFEDYGITINGVGSKYDYYGTRGEGRGGWSTAMYTGISSLDNTTPTASVVPLATPGASTTGYENPFLYVASSAQKAAHPDWCFRRTAGGARSELTYTTDPDKTGDFYIFDFARYLSDRSVTTPDAITIQLGMNDFYSPYYTTAQAIANCTLGFEIIYSQIRAALPTVPIAFITYMPRYSNLGGFSSVNGIKNIVDLLNTFTAAKADANLHVLNCHALMNPDMIFDFTAGAALDATGNSTAVLNLAAPSDGVHFYKNGYIEFSKVVGGWLANVM